MTALRRTAIGRFTAAQAVALDALTPETWAGALRPTDAVVAHLPRVDLSAVDAADISLGRRVARVAMDDAPPLVRAYGPDGIFIGILKPSGAQWQAHKMFHSD